MKFNKTAYLNKLRGMPFGEIWKALGSEASMRYGLENRCISMRLIIDKYFFDMVPSFDTEQGDMLSRCKVCGKTAWLREDIKHTRTCEIGKALK